eukprot:TRINITY_DN17532_c0_g1_i1.p3 TRINITY_DN17532_c0_g1~~TRINITY_DN17532_c0_g1_i1.p3  ORF type:complete len:230 (+),score=27.93 TRINITY_DN17532_c0_g1_i1:186-875(+)
MYKLVNVGVCVLVAVICQSWPINTNARSRQLLQFIQQIITDDSHLVTPPPLNITLPSSTDECTTPYEIQPGDSLSAIAIANGMTLDELLELNPEIENPDEIFAGQQVTIKSSSCEDSAECAPEIYEIQARETLSFIATANGMTLEELLEMNPEIENPDDVKPRQEIKIKPATCVECVPEVHVVVSGDTLSHIAVVNGMSLGELLEINPQIDNPNLIFTDQKIFISDCQG